MKRVMKLRVITALLAFSVAATLVLGVTTGLRLLSHKSPDARSAKPLSSIPVLSTVDAESLASGGISLESPSGQSPVIGRQAAEAAVAREYPTFTVLESVLAHVLDPGLTTVQSALANDVWVVSMGIPGGVLPIGGPPGADPSARVQWFLVAISAATGTYVYSAGGSFA